MKEYPSRPNSEASRDALLKKIDGQRNQLSGIRYEITDAHQRFDDVLNTVRASVEDGTYQPTSWPEHAGTERNNVRSIELRGRKIFFLNPASFLLAVDELVKKRTVQNVPIGTYAEKVPVDPRKTQGHPELIATVGKSRAQFRMRDMRITNDVLAANPKFLSELLTTTFLYFSEDIARRRNSLYKETMPAGWHWSTFLQDKIISIVPGRTSLNASDALSTRSGEVIELGVHVEDLIEAHAHADNSNTLIAETLARSMADELVRTQHALDCYDILRAKYARLASHFGMRTFSAANASLIQGEAKQKSALEAVDALYAGAEEVLHGNAGISRDEMRATPILLELVPEGMDTVQIFNNADGTYQLKLSGVVRGRERVIADCITRAVIDFRKRREQSHT